MADQSLTVQKNLVEMLPAPLASRWNSVTRSAPFQRARPALVVSAAAGLAALAWAIVMTQPARDVTAGMSEAERSAVADMLKAASLKYRVDRTTGALLVSDEDYYQARMLMAAKGLPKAPVDADMKLDKIPLGASHAVEAERVRQAREAELGRMIESMDGVDQARVTVAAGASSPFIGEDAPAKASVMLTMAGSSTLSSTQVQAIVNLVASSVPGLNADAVTIADQRGRLLSGGITSPAALESNRQIDVQLRTEERLRQALASLLTPLLGAEGFTSEIHADLDFTENQSTRQSYPEGQRALSQEQMSWTAGPGEAQARGIPGALSNQVPAPSSLSLNPAPTAQASAAVTGRTSEDATRQYQVGSEVSVTRSAMGTTRRLSVAVAIKSMKERPIGKVELKNIERLVQSAVGYDPSRGDTVVVSLQAFQQTPQIKPSWVTNLPLALIIRVTGIVTCLAIIIFGFVKPWRKANTPQPIELAPLLDAELNRQRPESLPVTLDMISDAPSYAERAALVRDFVAQNPQRAAGVLRKLLSPSEPASR